MHANATRRCAKLRVGPLPIHSKAHSALRFTAGTVSIARKRPSFSNLSSTSLSIMRLYVSPWIDSLND